MGFKSPARWHTPLQLQPFFAKMADQYHNLVTLGEDFPSITDFSLSLRTLLGCKSRPLLRTHGPPPPTPAYAPQTELQLADIFQNDASFVNLSPIEERYRAVLVDGKRLSPSEFLAHNSSESVDHRPVSPPIWLPPNNNSEVMDKPELGLGGNESFSELYHKALTHVLVNEPDAFWILQDCGEIRLGLDIYFKAAHMWLLPRYQTKLKKMSKRASRNFIVHGFVYEYSAYSPSAAELDVLTATDGKDKSSLMKQWDVNLFEWADFHKTKYGTIIDLRKIPFHGIISDGVYKRINNLKNAHLSTFTRSWKAKPKFN